MKQTTKEHETKINRVIIYYVLLAIYRHTHTHENSQGLKRPGLRQQQLTAEIMPQQTLKPRVKYS